MVDVDREKRLQFLWSAAHHYVTKTPALSASLMLVNPPIFLCVCNFQLFQEQLRTVVGY